MGAGELYNSLFVDFSILIEAAIVLAVESRAARLNGGGMNDCQSLLLRLRAHLQQLPCLSFETVVVEFALIKAIGGEDGRVDWFASQVSIYWLQDFSQTLRNAFLWPNLILLFLTLHSEVQQNFLRLTDLREAGRPG